MLKGTFRKMEMFFLFVIKFPDCKLSISILQSGTILQYRDCQLMIKILSERDNAPPHKLLVSNVNTAY